MDKAIGAVVAVVAILALALGAVCGVAWGLSKAWQSPAMVAALARQESARADTLQAQADKERAAADAAGAWSRSSSLLAIEWSRRWPLVVALVLTAAALVALGSSASWVRWAWSRSSVVPLPGGLIAFREGPAVVVIDPTHMIGGVLRLDRAGVRPVLQTSEDLAADIARAALVARAVEKVGGNESRAELAARVTESLSTAFANLAGSTAPAISAASGPAAPALRLVRVRSGAEKKKAALIDDTAELREFVEQGAARGFQRREWAGYKFKSTGRACSQTRWATLAGWLREAELLDGSALICPASEAMERLGYDAGGDAGESESEQ